MTPRRRVWLFLAVAALLPGHAAAANEALEEARAHHRAGRLDEAVAGYTRVIESSDVAAERGAAYNNRCLIHARRGALDAARADCEAALRARAPGDDDARRARTLNNLALVLERQGRYTEAAARYRDALAINSALGDAAGRAVNHQNLGTLAIATADYAGALAHFDAVERLVRANGEAVWTPRQRLLARLNRAVTLERIGAFDDALRLLDHVADHAGDDAPDLLGDVYLNRAVVLRNLGDPHGALRGYDEAESVLGDAGALAFVDLNRAIVALRDLGRPAQAAERLERLLADPAHADEFALAAAARYLLVRAWLDAGRPDAAQTALAALLDVGSADAAGDTPWLRADAAARVAAARGDLDTAVERALAAVEAVESARAGLAGDRLRELFLSERRASYALAVALLHERGRGRGASGDAARALDVAMRAKSHALLDRLGKVPTAPAGDAVAALQARLGDAVLLEYFVAGDTIYAWTLTATTLDLRALDAAAQRLDQARRLRAALAAGQAPDPALRAGLSQALIPALAAGAPLVVAPHDALAGMPFELLEQEGVPLFAARSVSYVPTGSLWRARPALSPSGRELVAFARPQTQTGGEAAHPILRALPELPHAAREVNAIRAKIGGEVDLYLGEAATEAALVRLAGRSSEVLHIAGHALLDGSLADGSVLVLGAGDGHDGLVFAHELAGLDLAAQLTVLSACSTARGAHDATPPIALLTGALLSAGSRAVLATLWDVPDAPAAAFMQGFYARLVAGEPPAAALRATKAAFMASRGVVTPQAWAAFVLVGDAPPLRLTPRPPPRWPLVVTAVGAAAALLLVVAWRRRPRA